MASPFPTQKESDLNLVIPMKAEAQPRLPPQPEPEKESRNTSIMTSVTNEAKAIRESLDSVYDSPLGRKSSKGVIGEPNDIISGVLTPQQPLDRLHSAHPEPSVFDHQDTRKRVMSAIPCSRHSVTSEIRIRGKVIK